MVLSSILCISIVGRMGNCCNVLNMCCTKMKHFFIIDISPQILEYMENNALFINDGNKYVYADATNDLNIEMIVISGNTYFMDIAYKHIIVTYKNTKTFKVFQVSMMRLYEILKQIGVSDIIAAQYKFDNSIRPRFYVGTDMLLIYEQN